jgi:hypothetical protein
MYDGVVAQGTGTKHLAQVSTCEFQHLSAFLWFVHTPTTITTAKPEHQELCAWYMSDGRPCHWLSAGDVPAQMCRIADMWKATACLQVCFTALMQAEEELIVGDLAGVCSLLPDSVTTLPSYSEFKTRLQQCVVKAFPDVYTLLTTHDQLQRFRKLPFQAVLAWADSDNLVVDSENSVAVALSWWYGGDLGSQATEDQVKELSGALCLKHLSNGMCIQDVPAACTAWVALFELLSLVGECL